MAQRRRSGKKGRTGKTASDSTAKRTRRVHLGTRVAAGRHTKGKKDVGAAGQASQAAHANRAVRGATAARRGKSGRPDGRGPRELRPITITSGYIKYAEGSALIEMGHTKVVCTATVEDIVPPFLRDTGRGWVTAEYGMLPRSTNTRNQREASRGRIGGRTSEIQRMIGRVLRSVVNFSELGERQVRIDCDVLQADGGTRTAAITGGFVALAQAADGLVRARILRKNPIREAVAAVSVGIVGGRAVVDLAYQEDSRAEVDMNVAMTASGRFVEVQGTAEQVPFTRVQMERMTVLATEGMRGLFEAQRAALETAGITLPRKRRDT